MLKSESRKSIIKKIEELSLDSWPTLHTMMYDGWVLRFANGFTKRSNSVNPLYFSTFYVHEKIQYCERIYENKGLKAVFKMTPSVYPEDLDEILEFKGYLFDSETSVQVLKLENFNISPQREAILQTHLSQEWLNHFCYLTNIPEGHKSTLKKILYNIAPKACFASLRDFGENDVISCGLGVHKDKYLGVYNVVTNENFRNRGYGRQLVLNLLNWAKDKGVETVYLHVMVNNKPALKLYANLGFKEVYRYWYRIKKG
jgi:ribosomal protein S18 acetylase RimI-like enzyme